MAVGKITKTAVDRLQPGERIADSAIRGFIVRRLDSGAASYAYRYRVKGTNQQRLISLGIHGTITAEQARTLAKRRAGEVAHGKDPKGEQEETRAEAKREKRAEINTVNAILDAFEKDHVEGLRSGDQVKAAFKNHVRPRLGDKSIYDLKRSDITTMLNEIKAENGPVMADRVLAHVRKALNWQMVQDDEFKSPIVRGMAKTKPKERARKRILTDDEIRDVWAALDLMEKPTCYPAYVRNLLLTMTRRNESSEMNVTELDGDLWTIPAERYKNKLDHVVPLSAMALENLKTAPAPAKGINAYFLFSTATTNRPMGKTAFSGFSKAKAELNRHIAKLRKAAGKPAMPRWTLHDLRRTARTLMSRAGVPADHAERAEGHVIPGVRGTYDRYEYLDEKRKAFEALAQLVALILNPPADNVVQIARGK
ncbi:integrase [Bradyrhizobium sp. AZCC 1588]|uniref:tyrosine-type recombinase/integrase n=1 Tax=unclassified Bradyrhizobium TaxID=2631580 RepID=UPI002FF363E6